MPKYIHFDIYIIKIRSAIQVSMKTLILHLTSQPSWKMAAILDLFSSWIFRWLASFSEKVGPSHWHFGACITKWTILSRKWLNFLDYMLYLKNRNRYRHVLGTKLSGMPNFIFNFNTYMGLKINAFWVIKEKPCFWTDILDFGGRHLGILRG